jgi:hypothetical protein
MNFQIGKIWLETSVLRASPGHAIYAQHEEPLQAQAQDHARPIQDQNVSVLQGGKSCKTNFQGRCVKGDKCPFAHGEEELRKKPNLKKTKLCENHIKGKPRSSLAAPRPFSAPYFWILKPSIFWSRIFVEFFPTAVKSQKFLQIFWPFLCQVGGLCLFFAICCWAKLTESR